MKLSELTELENWWASRTDPALVAAWRRQVPNAAVRATKPEDRKRFEQGWQAAKDASLTEGEVWELEQRRACMAEAVRIGRSYGARSFEVRLRDVLDHLTGVERTVVRVGSDRAV